MNYTTDKNATSVRIPQGVLSVEENATRANVTDGTDEDSYDYVGAKHFVVATLLVYSFLGVFCVLLSRIKRLRGKHHENDLNDESVSKYLKKQRKLKLNGRKMKFMYECELISQRVKQFEERQMSLNLEKDLLESFKSESPVEKEQKRKRRKKKRDIGNSVGLMGASVFYIDSNSSSYSSLDSQYLPPVAEDIETDATDDKYEHAYVTRDGNDDDNVDEKTY
jgi:hypothetical protein